MGVGAGVSVGAGVGVSVAVGSGVVVAIGSGVIVGVETRDMAGEASGTNGGVEVGSVWVQPTPIIAIMLMRPRTVRLPIAMRPFIAH